jgi:uncharacterized protein (TIGR03435 family)
MKHRDRKLEDFVLKHMGLFEASADEMDRAEARLQERLRSASTDMMESSWETVAGRPKRAATRFVLAIGIVAAAVVLGIYLRRPQPIDVHATVLSADGSLSRIDASVVHDLRSEERIEAGQRLRTNDATGSIALADGSRVEMRARSEFALERADDGVRLHLFKGSLIIKAAKQGARHLYVQTKDVTVSVVGTVFLVNAEEEGSRVAVIEGEVRVQQGATTKNLLPGQQLATNPKMSPLAVKEEASWSQSTEIQTAILQQPTVAAPQKAVETRATFEVISIRPSGPRAAGNRGAPPGAAPAPALPAGANEVLARLNGCAGPSVELNPGRIVLNGATVYRLVALGYGLNSCQLAIQLGLLNGGPDWSRTDRYDIQATIPAGSPAYTRQELTDGVAPKLQEMIRNLLTDRFNLVLRRGTKDIQAFDLVVAKPGKIKLSEDQNPPDAPVPGRGFVPNALPRGMMLNCSGSAIAISRLVSCLQNMAGGTIVDNTDLEGLYDIPMVTQVDPSVPMSSAYRLSQILEQTGLKLEAKKASHEVLTIERVDRPSEN